MMKDNGTTGTMTKDIRTKDGSAGERQDAKTTNENLPPKVL